MQSAPPWLALALALVWTAAGSASAQPAPDTPLTLILVDSAFTAPPPGANPIRVDVALRNDGPDTFLVGGAAAVEVDLQRWGGAGWESATFKLDRDDLFAWGRRTWAGGVVWGYRDHPAYDDNLNGMREATLSLPLAPGDTLTAPTWVREPGRYRAVLLFSRANSYLELSAFYRAYGKWAEPGVAYSAPFAVGG